MFRKRLHLSARELLLAADHDLSPRRLARARGHLAACASCVARMSVIERTIADAARVSGQSLPTSLPPAAVSRARLRMRLAESSISQRPLPSLGDRWVLACIALLIASVGALSLITSDATPAFVRAIDRESGVFLLPRADLTPGATRPVSAAEVCGADRYGRTQPIPAAVHQRVFESYGADYGRSDEYELDYLITPELGGTADRRNLWPQPFSRTPWNAYVKDELELYFHRMVCDGKIDFVTAQREMTTDWIAAYKRHFSTDAPLRDYAASPLTERDRDLLRSELEELGIPMPAGSSDGPTLMAMLLAARPDIQSSD